MKMVDWSARCRVYTAAKASVRLEEPLALPGGAHTLGHGMGGRQRAIGDPGGALQARKVGWDAGGTGGL